MPVTVRRQLRTYATSGRRYRHVLSHSKKPAKPSKAVTKYVKRTIRASQETKYVSAQLQQNNLLDAAIHTPWTSSSVAGDILPLCPQLTEGTSEYQRVGRKVKPVRSYVDIVATFPQVIVGQVVDPSLPLTDEIFVTMYIVKSKVYKNYGIYQSQSASLPAPTQPWQTLLDSGDVNTGSVPFGYLVTSGAGPTFYATDNSLLGMPINKEQYTLVKKKVVKLIRNNGMMTGDGQPGQAPNLPQSVWKGRMYYRLPTLIYDDTKGQTQLSGFPTNNNTMLMVGYTQCNNEPSYTVDGTGAINIPNNRLSISVRTHCWFKDA